MATSTINATYQGYVGVFYSNTLVNWTANVRNAATGTFAATYTSNVTANSAILSTLTSGRTGYNGSCNRVFLFFDLSSISGTISAATLKVFAGTSSTATQTIVVEGTAWGGGGGTSTLSTGDYDSLDHATAYSSKKLSWQGVAYNDFTMNATAISDMNTNGYLNCAVIEGDYDYDNQNPSVGTTVSAGVEYLDPTNKIKLDITYTTGYGNDVIGVSSTTIVNVIGVATADIDNIIGV